MAKNNFPFAAAGVFSDAYAVTPDDDADLDPVPQALWIGTTGDLTVKMPSGDIELLEVAAGTLLPLRAIRVLEATTAQDIIALV
jgi:hypothetical protein